VMQYRCVHCGVKLTEPIPVAVAYCSPGCREADND